MNQINIGYHVVYRTPYGKLTHSNINDPHVKYAREHGTLQTIISSEPATCTNKFCSSVKSEITGFEFNASGKTVGMIIKIDHE